MWQYYTLQHTYPMTPHAVLAHESIYISLSVNQQLWLRPQENVMKTIEEKAKAILIDIENLANKTCSEVLNVKTSKLAQTSLRDGMIQSIGNMLKSKVISNRNMQKSTRKEIADDAILQATSTTDFEVMKQVVLFITQKYPGRAAETPEERAIREMSA